MEMMYVAYYADGGDTEAYQPEEWGLERIVRNAWEDNIDGNEKLGPDPCCVEVYDADGNLIYHEQKLKN